MSLPHMLLILWEISYAFFGKDGSSIPPGSTRFLSTEKANLYRLAFFYLFSCLQRRQTGQAGSIH